MSNPKSPPFCHFIFSFGGFILSVLTINTIANEIIDILQAIGVIYNLSDAILGLTILAWGNSLGGESKINQKFYFIFFEFLSLNRFSS